MSMRFCSLSSTTRIFSGIIFPRLPYGYDKGKAAALAEFARHLYAPAMQFNQFFGERQPEPRTLVLFIIDRIQLRELLEKLQDVLRLDPDAGILDTNLYFLFSGAFPCHDPYGADVGREFHRIAQKIEQYLFEFPFISLDHHIRDRFHL